MTISNDINIISFPPGKQTIYLALSNNKTALRNEVLTHTQFLLNPEQLTCKEIKNKKGRAVIKEKQSSQQLKEQAHNEKRQNATVTETIDQESLRTHKMKAWSSGG